MQKTNVYCDDCGQLIGEWDSIEDYLKNFSDAELCRPCEKRTNEN